RHRGLSGGVIHVAAENAGALGRQFARNGASEAGADAGDDGRTTGKPAISAARHPRPGAHDAILSVGARKTSVSATSPRFNLAWSGIIQSDGRILVRRARARCAGRLGAVLPRAVASC